MKLLALAIAAIAIILALTQSPFAGSRFEYGAPRDFDGVLSLAPYPHLTGPTGTALLAAAGKHGAQLPPALEGTRVTLRGTLIERGPDRMIQLESAPYALGPATPTAPEDLGPITVTGEIVDLKCHLGVMNPGNGQVHRDCAARCLSGGLPAGLYTPGRLYWLAGVDRRVLTAHAGERAEVHGQLLPIGNAHVIDARSVQFP